MTRGDARDNIKYSWTVLESKRNKLNFLDK